MYKKHLTAFILILTLSSMYLYGSEMNVITPDISIKKNAAKKLNINEDLHQSLKYYVNTVRGTNYKRYFKINNTENYTSFLKVSNDSDVAEIEFESLSEYGEKVGNIKFTCPANYYIPNVVFDDKFNSNDKEGRRVDYKLKNGKKDDFEHFEVIAKFIHDSAIVTGDKDSTIQTIKKYDKSSKITFDHHKKDSRGYQDKYYMVVNCVPEDHINDYCIPGKTC